MKHWWSWLLALAVLLGLLAAVSVVTTRKAPVAERIRATILKRTNPGTPLEAVREHIKANGEWKITGETENPDGTRQIHVWLGNYSDFPRTWFGVEAGALWVFDAEGRLTDISVDTFDE
jgi:hypothetical protein